MKKIKTSKSQLNGEKSNIPLPIKDKKNTITQRLRAVFMNRFTKINTFLLNPTILVLALLPFVPAHSEEKTTTNLITNGTFESGNSNSWTTTGDVTVLNDCCGSNYDLEFGDSGSIEQSVNLTTDTITQPMLNNGVTLNSSVQVQNGECAIAGCWGGQGGADTFTIRLQIRDSDNNVLATTTQERTNVTGINGKDFTDSVSYSGTGSNIGNIFISGTDANAPANLGGANLDNISLTMTYDDTVLNTQQITSINTAVEEIEEVIELFENLEIGSEEFIETIENIEIPEELFVEIIPEITEIEEMTEIERVVEETYVMIISAPEESIEIIEQEFVTEELPEESLVEIFEEVLTENTENSPTENVLLEENNTEEVSMEETNEKEEVQTEIVRETETENETEATETNANNTEEVASEENEIQTSEQNNEEETNEISNNETLANNESENSTATNTESDNQNQKQINITVAEISEKVSQKIKSIDQQLKATSMIVSKIMTENSNVDSYSNINLQIFNNQPIINGGDLSQYNNIAYLDNRNIYNNQISYSDKLLIKSRAIEKAKENVIKAEQNLRRIRNGF